MVSSASKALTPWFATLMATLSTMSFRALLANKYPFSLRTKTNGNSATFQGQEFPTYAQISVSIFRPLRREAYCCVLRFPIKLARCSGRH